MTRLSAWGPASLNFGPTVDRQVLDALARSAKQNRRHALALRQMSWWTRHALIGWFGRRAARRAAATMWRAYFVSANNSSGENHA